MNKRSFKNDVMKTTADNYECIHQVFRPWFRGFLYDKSIQKIKLYTTFYRGLIYTDKSTVQLIHRNLMSKYEDAACNFHACIGVEDCSVKT